MLVEDEIDAVRALERLFRSCGFSMVVATSLAEARALFARWREQPCAYAFVDNKLADGVGVDLLPDLRKLEPPPAVAMVSNWMTSELAALAFRGGAVPMAKPDDEQTLRDLVALLDARREKTAHSERWPQSSALDGAAQPLAFGPFTLFERDLETPTGRHRLRRAERSILAFLAAREGRPASPQQIASEALNRNDDGAVRSVYSHVTNLRAALGAYAALVETVPGAAGYRVAVEIFER
ncbi:MAG TPA: response regulator transcription factor [Polyangiaceae bacterium]|nr:response regulator transcription factor [Polyangiaceae bacterium]